MKNFTRTIVMSIALCFALASAEAQYVTIPDANFVAWLNANGFASCMNGNQMDTTCSAIVNETYINCNHYGIPNKITDLTGIRYFDHLTTLDCHNNLLTSLPTLPSSLISLNCNDNQLNSLPVLPPSLTYLECAGNQLTSLPALPVTLAALECAGNQLSSFPPFPASLTSIDCAYNQFTSLPTLPPSLSGLYCSNNQLTSLPALPSTLTILYCRVNNLTSLPSLPSSLRELYCYVNQLTSLPALPSSLIEAEVWLNQLTSLPALPASLTILDCHNNQLTSVPSIPASLTTLVLNDNQLISLPALPDTMNYLGLTNNPGLTCIPAVNRINHFYWGNSGINCFANTFTVVDATPTIAGVPICAIPNQPGLISGDTTICQGTSQVYSIPIVPNVNSYIWTLPTGWAGSSTTNSITVTAGSTGGNISVVANECKLSIPRSLSITIAPQPSPPASIKVTGGIAKVCPGDNRIFTVPLLAGFTYNWTVPTGAVINSGQGTRSINVTYNNSFTRNGIVSVVKVKGCSISLPKTINVNMNLPAPPSAITGQSYGLCGAINKTYSVIQTTGLSYFWTVPPGAIITNGQGTNSITANFPNTNFNDLIYANGENTCGQGNPRVLTVKAIPSTPVSITGPTTACANQQNVGYSTSAVASAISYTWGVPSGATITSGQGTNAIVMKFGTASGNVKVRAMNGCGAGIYKNLAVTINCREEMDDGNDWNVLVYPNPSKDVFTVSTFPKFKTLEKFAPSIIVRDVIGRVVYQKENILTSGFEFGSELKAGIYFAEIKQVDERKIVRLIKSN